MAPRARPRSRSVGHATRSAAQSHPQGQSDHQAQSLLQPPSFLSRRAQTILCLIALIYALFAGLRTTGDHDLGWQLATGRWIVQHRTLPSTDVLSFTAHGQPWIYPALSQLLLYCTYVIGGYSLLSWLGAAACLATIALLLLRGGMATALLALIAVPLIASRTAPRAEMFTQILFAAFLSLLWHYHRSGRARLWLLPILMCLWTNLHLGFIAGLVLIAAYVALELGEAAFPHLRPAAFERLRHAAPWLLATIAATLLNPWGARIYVAYIRQSDVLGTHSNWIREWSGLRITPAKLLEIFAWRDPKSALWWMLLIAIAAAILAAYLRKIIPAILLAASVYIAIHALRMEAPFASIVVIIGGSILADAIELKTLQRLRDRFHSLTTARIPVVDSLFVFAISLFVAIRIYDLVTNHFYLETPQQYAAFGDGPSYWYPLDAAVFVLRDQLPGNIFNDYNSGGFLVWSLFPSYPDYIDGRAIPFGDSMLINSMQLLTQPLDSPAWQSEADARNLNTVFVSTDSEMSAALPELRTYCSSRQWRPVYLDTHAAIFVRSTPGNAALLNRLQITCDSIHFDHPPDTASSHGRADAFHYYLNAAYILHSLGKPAEALESADRAEQIFSGNASLHFIRGFALQNLKRWPEAEDDLKIATQLGSDDAALALAAQYDQSQRYADEVETLSRAAERSDRPYYLYSKLGYAQLAMGDSRQALRSFDRAEKESPFTGAATSLGASFRAQIEEGRRRAHKNLGEN